MHQLDKLIDAIWLLQHWVTRVKPPLGFEPGSPAWEADDLLTELSIPPGLMLLINRFMPIYIASCDTLGIFYKFGLSESD